MLVAFAGHEFQLSRRTKDGLTERDHLLAAQKIGRVPLAELVSPEVPDWLMYLWTWFAELHQGRQTGIGTQPLAWSEMLAWSMLTGRTLTPWEVYCLRSIDRAWMDAQKKAD